MHSTLTATANGNTVTFDLEQLARVDAYHREAAARMAVEPAYWWPCELNGIPARYNPHDGFEVGGLESLHFAVRTAAITKGLELDIEKHAARARYDNANALYDEHRAGRSGMHHHQWIEVTDACRAVYERVSEYQDLLALIELPRCEQILPPCYDEEPVYEDVRTSEVIPCAPRVPREQRVTRPPPRKAG